MSVRNAFQIPEHSAVLGDNAIQRSDRVRRQRQLEAERAVRQSEGRVGEVDLRARRFGQRTGWKVGDR